MNVGKLLALLKEHRDTQEVLANAIGISRTRLSFKIHGKYGATFTQPEISAIKKRYQLTPQQIDDIFFNQNVS